MPNERKGRYKRKYKKRYNGRSRYARKQFLVSPNAPISQNALVKMRYVETRNINPSATIADYLIYRANSVYDPYQGTGGDQPTGFDQWMLFYNHFNVVGSKITVTFNTTDATDAGNAIGLVSLRDSTTVETDITTLRRQAGAVWKPLTPMGSNRSVQTIKKYFSAKKFFKVKDTNQSEYKGTISGNPSEEAYYHVYVGAGNSRAVDPAVVDVNVTIDYIVLLSERKPLADS